MTTSNFICRKTSSLLHRDCRTSKFTETGLKNSATSMIGASTSDKISRKYKIASGL